MKNSFKIMVLAAIPLSLGGCVDVGDLMDQPQSQEKPIYVQNSLSLGGQPQAVSVQRSGGAYPDQVEVCLFNSRGWDKQFSVENYPFKRAAAGSATGKPNHQCCRDSGPYSNRLQAELDLAAIGTVADIRRSQWLRVNQFQYRMICLQGLRR